VQSLGTIAGAHGIGRFQTAGGWTEAPAAVVLHHAHRALQERLWDADQRSFARTVGQRYAEIIERGGWFRPLREALDAFVTQSQRTVSGVVRLTLFKTTCEAAPDA
jgi:argininosuccinate synthase